MAKDIEMEVSQRITVLMPAYNAARYIELSIQSVLAQTYKEFKLLIINDGSSDDTENRILSIEDKRIIYIKNEKNIGLVNTLNKGIELTKTEYLVRMDADDIAVPERLEWQLSFMDQNPEIEILGGKYEIIGDEQGVPVIPLLNDEIKATLLFNNPICHPSVMLRTDIFKKYKIKFGEFKFNDDFGFKVTEIEDYIFWHKLKRVTSFHNLDKVILKYRKEGQNFSTANKDIILSRKKEFYKSILMELNVIPDEFNLLLHIDISNIIDSTSVSDLVKFSDYLSGLLDNNFKKKIYPHSALVKIVEQKWNRLFFFLPSLGSNYVFAYWKCSRRVKWAEFIYFFKWNFRFVKKK